MYIVVRIKSITPRIVDRDRIDTILDYTNTRITYQELRKDKIMQTVSNSDVP